MYKNNGNDRKERPYTRLRVEIARKGLIVVIAGCEYVNT